MTKNNVMRFGIIAICLLILIGVILLLWLRGTEEESNVIRVDLDGKTEPLRFERLAMIPGDSCEYTLTLDSDRVKQLDVRLDFVELEEKTLKDFARVKLLSGETVLFDELLRDAIEGELPTLPVNFSTGENTVLKVVYYLPLEVGNEAKRAEASFELRIFAISE